MPDPYKHKNYTPGQLLVNGIKFWRYAALGTKGSTRLTCVCPKCYELWDIEAVTVFKENKPPLSCPKCTRNKESKK